MFNPHKIFQLKSYFILEYYNYRVDEIYINYCVLRTYYYDNGVKTILNPNAGTVDYINGIVTLNAFNPSDVNNVQGVLSIQAVPTSTILYSNRDKILTLDNTDPNAINVNLTAKS